MAKNDLAARLQRDRKAFLEYGNDVGFQMAMDFVGVVLHRQGWGATRLRRLTDEVEAVQKEYGGAYRPGMEQDILQERMDRELRAALGNPADFTPFTERYPGVKAAGYDRLPMAKKRRH